MATMKIRTQFELSLSGAEIKVVEAALSGRLQPEHVEAARRLAAEITRAKDNATVDYFQRVLTAAQQLFAKQPPPAQPVIQPQPSQSELEAMGVIVIVPRDQE